jgi:hypothetical protein
LTASVGKEHLARMEMRKELWSDRVGEKRDLSVIGSCPRVRDWLASKAHCALRGSPAGLWFVLVPFWRFAFCSCRIPVTMYHKQPKIFDDNDGCLFSSPNRVPSTTSLKRTHSATRAIARIEVARFLPSPPVRHWACGWISAPVYLTSNLVTMR